MKPELQKTFDKELKKELNKGRRIWIYLALAIVLVLVIYTPIFSTQVYGETIELSIRDRGNVSKMQMTVKLDAGKVIVILVENNLQHLTGKQVELSKMASVAGLASYQFVQYVD